MQVKVNLNIKSLILGVLNAAIFVIIGLKVCFMLKLLFPMTIINYISTHRIKILIMYFNLYVESRDHKTV